MHQGPAGDLQARLLGGSFLAQDRLADQTPKRLLLVAHPQAKRHRAAHASAREMLLDLRNLAPLGEQLQGFLARVLPLSGS